MNQPSRLTAIRKITGAAERATAISLFLSGLATRNALPGYSAENMTSAFIAMLETASSTAASKLERCVSGLAEFPQATWNQAVNCLEDINANPDCLRQYLPKLTTRLRVPLKQAGDGTTGTATPSVTTAKSRTMRPGQRGPAISEQQIALEAELRRRKLLL